MDYFAQDLKFVTCDNDLSLTFTDNATYTAAINDWDWVNFYGNRNFIMVVNYGGCDADDARQPWIVTNAEYDNPSSTVHFTAYQTTWKDLNNTLIIRKLSESLDLLSCPREPSRLVRSKNTQTYSLLLNLLFIYIKELPVLENTDFLFVYRMGNICRTSTYLAKTRL
jgi:hypothetical protein